MSLGVGQAAGADVAAGQAARPRARRRARRGGAAWPGCPARPGAPTSRCASPGRRRTGARVASSVAVSRSCGDAGGVGAEEPGGGRAPRPRGRRPGRAGCAGSGRRRPTARSAPARRPAPRTWSRPTKCVAPSVRTGDDVGAGVDQPAADLDRLVGGDAAGDAEDDPPPGECTPDGLLAGLASAARPRRRPRPRRPPARRPGRSARNSILSAAISSKAIDSGLRATEVTCGGTIAPEAVAQLVEVGVDLAGPRGPPA